MLKAFVVAVVGLVALATLAADAKFTSSEYWGEYNTTSGPVEGKINVHLVPHTHDDTVRWLITVDQYYTTAVNYILDTVMTRLEENPDRKFIYVETGFFERWWIQRNEETKKRFAKLVANGQLEFVNGGWCMHDEAGPHYVEMVENTARGHLFLKKNFGIAPNGTWQIDPFGHTNTQAWLIGQYAGLQYLYFGRMDNQDFNMRKNLSSMVAPDVPRSLEWVWQGSKTFGSEFQTFTGELYGGGGGGYGAPNGLDFDGSDNQVCVQDDPRLHDFNLDSFVETFISAAKDQAQHMRTEHIMWAMGSDFNYQNADHWYNNLDKLIHHINKNGTVNAFYSTPTIYTKWKHKAGLKWEARYDDVMPLADNAHHYWSGYFTSRQSLKKYLRVMSNLLTSSRQLALLTNTSTCTSTTTDNLEAAIAVSTHHDGLSGTEKQAVADDYSLRIAGGEQETRGMVAQVFDRLAGMKDAQFCNTERGLNISFCPFTTDAAEFSMIAYNPQGQRSKQVFRVPIASSHASVVSSTGKAVPSQVVPLTDREIGLSKAYLQFQEMDNKQRVAEFTNNATHVVTFVADVPAVGYETFTISTGSELVNEAAASASTFASPFSAVRIANEYYELSFDGPDATASVRNLKTNVTERVAIDIGFYNSSLGGCTYGSGAYIFRPNNSMVWPAACTDGNCTRAPKITASTGPLVSEVYITYANWATLIVRLISGVDRIEVEYTVGPIPQANFEGGSPYLQGKEVVLRYNTTLSTNGHFFTDSNAREMVERVYNKRGPAYPNPYQISEPAAGNYYPVNALMALEDKAKNVGFSVAVDRSLGGASLASGSLELMVHRRTQADDSRGVGQPMNETMCGCRDQDPNNIGQCNCTGLIIKGINYLYLDSIPNTNAARRTGSEDLNFSPVVAFSASKPTKPSFAGLGQDLPQNVKLMTLGVVSPQYNDRVFLRLAHLFEAGEHPELSKPVNVSLAKVFSKKGLTVTAAQEVSLTGNRTPQELEDMKFKWNVAGEEEQMPKVQRTFAPGQVPFDENDASLTVTLRPMEIRTFTVDLQ
ncbi:hypothetical protein PTSG_06149 [Salpingoeca rosetta]|uniref:Alpha-mannosidase n=1 Tax=Salpingoeca rosetta (strain ATCC 50818 / BSB-021) TaxID=946362 RepID=F2UC33_SALR5|nr:uncharacterized protein PTSG_06149 [Salpingoeca rosetta]EGD74140.1 hypothetical protein PTSG_06149 [Salpingoeca rosetta]|eukprot:XP_004993041.1 hypothetical protein PTSG_06149 [Salpingoeca rosetta]